MRRRGKGNTGERLQIYLENHLTFDSYVTEDKQVLQKYDFIVVLKGQCHEDFAVLDQFWAKIITLKLYSLTKCFCKATTKISNEFYQRGLTIIKFLRIF